MTAGEARGAMGKCLLVALGKAQYAYFSSYPRATISQNMVSKAPLLFRIGQAYQ